MSALDERAFVVPRDQVAEAWKALGPIVSRVTDVPWTPADVLAQLIEGKAQAWGMRDDTGVRCVLITRVESTMTTRYGILWIAAGSGIVDGMQLFREYIEPWFFDDQGCEWIDIHGRRGWARLLQDYEEAAVVLRKNGRQRSRASA